LFSFFSIFYSNVRDFAFESENLIEWQYEKKLKSSRIFPKASATK